MFNLLSFSTDKVAHGYLPSYLKIAAEIGDYGHVCELGVYAGGSLMMWQALFPCGVVVGVDCNPTAVWPIGTKKLVANQTSVALPNQLKELSPEGYDLIVDDCSHDGDPTLDSWKLLWPLIKPGRYYVIEDWFVAFPPWAEDWNGGTMLSTAQSFLPHFVASRNEYDLESAEYKHGLIILKKSK